MPTFSFKCSACEAVLDTFLPSYKSPFPSCVECGKDALTRQIAGVVPHSLKGTGWAVDGYSCTDVGAESVSVKADRHGKGKSFAGQKVRG